MVRTQVMLDNAQIERVRRVAHVHGISFAEAVRRLLCRGLDAGLQADDLPGRSPAALLKLSGIARGGPRDLAVNHDKYLAKDRDW